MEFSLAKAIEILERTPQVVIELTKDLSPVWTQPNEGDNTWSVYDVIGHLIHGEKTDWIIRTDIILHHADKNFIPFDRFAQFENSKNKTLSQLLDEFKTARERNLEKLKSFDITEDDLSKTGMHPTFGTITLQQMLAAWVVHDLDHISQICRVMAKQLKNETGPWVEFLKILRQ